MKMKLKYIGIVMLALMVTSCQPADKSGRKTVSVSIPPEKYLLEQIVGDKVEIATLMPNVANPESYEPTMNSLLSLENSIAYLAMGTLPFEQNIAKKMTSNSNGLTISNMSEGIELIYGTHDHHHHHDGDEADCDEHHHGGADPHIWTSVKNARIIASNMLNAMVAADPENADYYRTNHKRLDVRLDSLDQAYTRKLEGAKSKSFVIWHPSLSYLSRDYGLTQIALGQESKESSVQQLKAQAEKAQEHGACVFFTQQEFDPNQAKTVTSQPGIKTVTLNPMNEDWEAEMNKIIDSLND